MAVKSVVSSNDHQMAHEVFIGWVFVCGEASQVGGRDEAASDGFLKASKTYYSLHMRSQSLWGIA